MNVVLDASAAFAMLLNRSGAPVFNKAIAEADRVYAPILYESEVTQVCWKNVRAGIMDLDNGKMTLVKALQLIDQFIDPVDSVLESLHEAIRLDHSAYDMFYLTLARRKAATLLTSDKKLYDLCISQGVDAVLA